MSEENRFFRWVWRFNAVVIALAVLGLVGIAAASLVWEYLRPWQPEKPVGHFAPVTSVAEARNTYRLRASGTIAFAKPGAQQVDMVFSLGDWAGNPSEYGLQDVSSARRSREAYNANLLLVNSETGEGHWLFSGVGRNVESWDAVIDPGAKDPVNVTPTGAQVIVASGATPRYFGDTQSVVAVILKVIEKDRNGDGSLDDKDGVSFYFYRLGDNAALKLLDVDLVLSQTQIGANRYAISYESKGAAFLAVFSVPDFKLVTRKPLPKLPS